uniref:Cytochrome P450 n=1 Tax=Aegilops tauschii subsp. strangulata TaxID=200361 RepID=A0A453C215_AEGTS
STTMTLPRPGAPLALEQIGDPALPHRALVENANAFAYRPPGLFPVALNLSSLPYGPHPDATSPPRHFTLHTSVTSRHCSGRPSKASSPGLSAQAPSQVVVRDHLYAAVFALVARACFGDGVDERHVSARQRVIQEFVVTAGELSGIPLGSRLAKLVHRRRLRHLFAFRGRQAELFLPLIAARRRSHARHGGVRRPYVDSLIDVRVPSDNTGSRDIDCRRALRDDEMWSLVSEFLGGGADTIVAIIEWTLAHLVIQPEVQSELRREVDAVDAASDKSLRKMPYLHAVVLESLRMHPSVPFVPHRVRAEDATLLGETTVPAGDFNVRFVVGDIGRDSKAWTDPDEFQPERYLAGGEAEGVGPSAGPKEMKMMPFGAGHRFCPGMGMAVVNIKCFLAALVREFEWAPPVEGGGGVDMTDLNVFFKVMKKPLSTRVTRRTRSV